MLSAAIDFGTSNSTATIKDGNSIKVVNLGDKTSYTPTVLFFNFEEKKFYVGDSAIKELENGELGRYFVSLKSFLGSSEIIETTLLQKEYNLEDLISIILKDFKEKIDRVAGKSVTKLTLGRPVKFNDNSKELDSLAENRLKNAAIKAGFKDIKFCYEPVAASLSYEIGSSKEELILVADIGGGTTDYTIIKSGKDREVLATNGIYIGGNNFDSKIIRGFVSSYLGEGSSYINMGKEMKISHSLYVDLYEYYKFIKMYDKQIIDSIKKYIQMAKDKEPISRLLELITDGYYFDFLQAVVNAKIELSSKDSVDLNMNFFTKPFSVPITKKEFNLVSKDEIDKIEKTLLDTLYTANLKAKNIDKVLLTGGTTLIPSVKAIYQKIFGEDKLIQTDVFSSVGYGLALY